MKNSLSLQKFFVKSTTCTYFVISLVNRHFHEIFAKNVWKCECGNYGNSFSRIFGKNSVKLTVLLNKLLKSWFDEIFFNVQKTCFYCFFAINAIHKTVQWYLFLFDLISGLEMLLSKFILVLLYMELTEKRNYSYYSKYSNYSSICLESILYSTSNYSYSNRKP